MALKLESPSVSRGILGAVDPPPDGPKLSTASKADIYEIVFREPGGVSLAARALDKVLYPKGLAWIRLLSSGQGRQVDAAQEARSWRNHGLTALYDLAEWGDVPKSKVDDFIKAAAGSGVVQVEIPWEDEKKGWAARIFPWEQLLALATKEERLASGTRLFSVVRLLKGATPRGGERDGTVFAVTADAEHLGYNFEAERLAIEKASGIPLRLARIPSLESVADLFSTPSPRRLHLVSDFIEEDDRRASTSKGMRDDQEISRVAGRVAASGAELVIYSSCYSGRRLAPLTVAQGADYALGFHGLVMDASLPGFFSGFYGELAKGPDLLAALRAGLVSNALQPNPHDLGCVTLWSAVSLIDHPVPDETPKNPATTEPAAVETISPDSVEDALLVSCVIEESLNYSVLHNNRGGLFTTFSIRKTKSGRVEPLEISVRLVTGLDQPAECRFYTKMPVAADQPSLDLGPNIILPLGSQLLRQRGESILGTVEVTIKCGRIQVFHKMQSIKLLPCDEWRDDETGRHLLPSFVFPRDPAVREVISAAQPFLRALRDHPQAGFDGYQDGSARSVILQTRAIWSALQHTLRLDYVNPPPSYTKASQRLRTPEEILRARRGTCIELTLMLASCWEHVGIYPVIFLTRGHAFAGFWTSIGARRDFVAGLDKLMQHAKLEEPAKAGARSRKTAGAAGLLRRVLDTPPPLAAPAGNRAAFEKPWMFVEAYLLAAIRSAVEEGSLASLETTYIPLQRPYAEALRDSGELLAQVPAGFFEGMIDVQTARDKGVTPMSILFQGVVA